MNWCFVATVGMGHGDYMGSSLEIFCFFGFRVEGLRFREYFCWSYMLL